MLGAHTYFEMAGYRIVIVVDAIGAAVYSTVAYFNFVFRQWFDIP